MGNNKIRPAEKQLLLENEELHRHVYELEETLNSIRNGEIDAIIVSGVDGDNIYSLTSVETKYRIIIEEMYQGAITLTKDGLITYCNSRFAELVSEPYERIIGTYFLNLLQESEVQNFLGLFKAGLGGKSVGELVYIKNNGHLLNLRLSISVLPDVIQNGVCILFSDITELKRQEEELVRLNALLEQKVDERTAELNKTIENLVYQQAATLKLSEELVKAKDILEDHNELLIREVTERRLVEAKLILSNKRFEALLLESPSNGAIYKIIRNEAGSMVDWEISDINELGAVSIGMDRASACGKSVLDLFGEQIMAPYFEIARQVEKSGIPHTFESYFEFNERYYLSSVFFVDHNHYANISFDITEQKKLSDKTVAQNSALSMANSHLKIAKAKAEESERLKTAFLSNMSHEIRTPMNGILGFAELLEEPGLTGDQQQEYISIIRKAGVRMLNIINNIVDISRIESKMMTVEIGELNINNHMEDLYLFFHPECESKSILLLMKNSLPSNQSIIKTDQVKVIAILTNLVKNAIKYSNKGVIEFGYIKKLNELEFFVKDQGIGILKERQEAIFERFIQADIADRHAYQGAGLGLAISKSYVEMLGGKIWVESEECIGSTFYFTLPYNGGCEESEIVEKDKFKNKDDQVFRKLKILLAEDDITSQKLISVLIKPFCKELLLAQNGVEAVEIYRSNPDIDIIFMDIQMPEMNGLEATTKIRQFNNKIIIIAQSAFCQKDDIEKALMAGCNDFISKPINKDQLLNLLIKYLN